MVCALNLGPQSVLQVLYPLNYLAHRKKNLPENGWICLFGWFLNVPVNNLAISRTGPKTERQTILRAATPETELGDHDFCLSQSHYTDTDPTSRERAATGRIEPRSSSPRVRALLTELPRSPRMFGLRNEHFA